MTAIHFDRRFTALMKYVIHGPVKPLGIVKDFFARVEFRNRGSPHYHIFFWVGNVPNDINEIQAKLFCNTLLIPFIHISHWKLKILNCIIWLKNFKLTHIPTIACVQENTPVVLVFRNVNA